MHDTAIKTFIKMFTGKNAKAYVDATKGQEFGDVKFLGGNALTLLRLLCEDFRGKDLSRTVLANADPKKIFKCGRVSHSNPDAHYARSRWI